MPRRIINGQPESLSATVVREFLTQHLPYRLEMLRLAEEHLPPSTTRESAFVEAAIVSGRILLAFLGVGLNRKSGLKLAENRKYHDDRGATDDVMIPDVGGRFVDVSSLDSNTVEVLTQFYNGASKAGAHFTWDSGHQLDLENLKRAIPMIRELVRTHLPTNATGV
jgi:hypothetical protein